jgi:hypothetical protein
MKLRQQPTFIVIGAMRAGTTSLHYNLSRHPEILMSKKKETDFFSEPAQWNKGKIWYLSQFRKTYSKCIGESSPGYTRRNMFPETSSRMHNFLPGLKLIYLVRAPMDRAVSHYIHALLTKGEASLPEKAFTEGTDIFFQSCYGYQIEPYRKLYKKSDILVMRVEDLWDRPFQEMKKIFTFLKVDSRFKHPDFSLPLNQTADLPPGGFFKPHAWKTFQEILDRGYFLDKNKTVALLNKFKLQNEKFLRDFKISDENWYDYQSFRKREKKYLHSLKTLTDNFFEP